VVSYLFYRQHPGRSASGRTFAYHVGTRHSTFILFFKLNILLSPKVGEGRRLSQPGMKSGTC